MVNSVEKYTIQFAPPVLPIPPGEYNLPAFAHFNNILRLYFNQLDNFIREFTDSHAVSFTTLTASATLTQAEFQVVICNNTSDITVTFPTTPENNDRVIIKRANTGGVKLSGTIDGVTELDLGAQYDAPTTIYSSSLSKWLLI
jgi:hypothetical protein|tara:strand:+ start:263 stop:691 length:429 start_codon:yes stop_codon:yes gene_type:complete